MTRRHGEPPLSPLHGLDGGYFTGMSATAYQRMRRRLQEQTSVAARMNEDGPGDPYAKTDANYDQQGVKDQGELHQAGDPPPYSLTPHTPEKLHDPTAVEDEGAMHQQGNPPPSSVEIRKGEGDKLGGEGDEFSDQARYAALDRREGPYTTASEENVSLAASGETEIDDLQGKNVAELRQIAKAEEVEGYSELRKVELRDAIRANRESKTSE